MNKIKRHKKVFEKLLKRQLVIVTVAALLLGPSSSNAAIELLLKDSQAWDGQSFSYLKGKAEITSVKLTLKAGLKAPFHCHPVPTMGFISKGKVKLENQAGDSKEFSQGDSVIEVMKGLHRGYALNGDAEIIVFYAGVKDVPNTVFPNDKENFARYCQ